MGKIENESFFLGVLDDELCAFFKNKIGEIYVAGAWECSIRESDISSVILIDVPEDYKNINKGYNG